MNITEPDCRNYGGDSLVRISMSGNVMKPDKKVIKMDT